MTPRRAPIAVWEGSEKEVELMRPLFGKHGFERVWLIDRPWPVWAGLLWRLPLELLRGRSPKLAYALAWLKTVSPRIVVTFIDNSTLFYEVGALMPEIRFLAIQNGTRFFPRDLPKKVKLAHREFACFGGYEPAHYAAHGATAERFHVAGSLRDAFYRKKHPGPRAKRRDVCFVSQIKPTHGQLYPKTMKCVTLIAEHVRRFKEKHGVSVVVAARRDSASPKWEWEEAWYKEHLGPSIEIVPNTPGDYTSYLVPDESRVSVAMHTTLLREAFGRGGRVLSCNLTGDPTFDFPAPGPWSLTDPSYEAFEKRLLLLLGMSGEDWTKACGEAPRFVMAGQDVPCDVYLTELIDRAVKS